MNLKSLDSDFVKAFLVISIMFFYLISMNELVSQEKRKYESVYDQNGTIQERLVKVDGVEYILLSPEKAAEISQEINECRFTLPNLSKRLENQKEISDKWEKIANDRLESLNLQRQHTQSCYSAMSEMTKVKEEKFYNSPFFHYFLGNLTCVGGFYLWEHARSN